MLGSSSLKEQILNAAIDLGLERALILPKEKGIYLLIGMQMFAFLTGA